MFGSICLWKEFEKIDGVKWGGDSPRIPELLILNFLKD